MQPETLFRDGRLSEAIAAQLEIVKGAPSHTGHRIFLAELAAFQGDWDRADRQLEAAINQDSKSGMLPLVMRQLLRAEILREQVFREGRPPELVVPLPEDGQLQLRIVMHCRNGEWEECNALLAQAEEVRPKVTGTCDGKAIEAWFDLDDRLRGVAEVLTGTGKYFWVPWSSVRSLEFAPPERPMDLIWRKATISVEGGPEGEVYIPVRYPEVKQWDEEEQLGRQTDWQEHPGGFVTGQGQRTLLVGEESRGILEVRELAMSLREER
jgi:type VI secretion system protein ImpE